MSKGIGPLQQEILDSLDVAMAKASQYRGSGGAPGWVCHKELKVRLHPDIYDLRAVLHYLAEKNGKLTSSRKVKRAYQVSFSKAVRGLVRRGIIEPLWLVPVVDWAPESVSQLQKYYHKYYLRVSEKARRFVRLSDYRVFASRSKYTLFNRRKEHEHYQRSIV